MGRTQSTSRGYIMKYELDDYLLVRNDKVIAVSGNEEFMDGDNPVLPQEGDTIAFVTTALGAIEYHA